MLHSISMKLSKSRAKVYKVHATLSQLKCSASIVHVPGGRHVEVDGVDGWPLG